MALRADHSDMPKMAADGNTPTKTPRFGPMLAQAWRAAFVDEAKMPHAVEGTRIRASWAGKCARDIGYRIRGVEPSNPTDIAGYWRMGLGTMVHERLQEVMDAAFPGAEIEKKVDFRPELDGSAHMDVFIVTTKGADERPWKIAIEVKTMNGFGFKKAIGSRGIAEGPRTGAVLQGALAARALDADELVILVLSLECLSDRELAKIDPKRPCMECGTTGIVDDAICQPCEGIGYFGLDPVLKFVAEWSLDRDGFTAIAVEEQERLRWILHILDTDEDALPPRYIPFEMPLHARVVDPASGAWTLQVKDTVVEAGSTWWCGYCDFRERCQLDLAEGK